VSRYKTAAAEQRALANLRPGPKAPPGNRLAESHGGYSAVSAEEREERVGRVFEALGEDAPMRGPDGGLPRADAVAVDLLARCLVRLERVERFHRDCGWLDPKTKLPRPSVDLEGRLRREALDLAESLGMTPRSRARLGLDLGRTFDLARHWAEQDGGGGGA
jgi:hypothetical protein